MNTLNGGERTRYKYILGPCTVRKGWTFLYPSCYFIPMATLWDSLIVLIFQACFFIISWSTLPPLFLPHYKPPSLIAVQSKYWPSQLLFSTCVSNSCILFVLVVFHISGILDEKWVEKQCQYFLCLHFTDSRTTGCRGTCGIWIYSSYCYWLWLSYPCALFIHSYKAKVRSCHVETSARFMLRAVL
jgi:hypothetical protein